MMDKLQVGEGLELGENLFMEYSVSGSVSIDDVQLASYNTDNEFAVRQGNTFYALRVTNYVPYLSFLTRCQLKLVCTNINNCVPVYYTAIIFQNQESTEELSKCKVRKKQRYII